MTATTTKLFAAITFIVALLSMGCDTNIASEDQAILGDACNPAEIAGVVDLYHNVLDNDDDEFGPSGYEPISFGYGTVSPEKMELVLDELCVDVRHPDALQTPPLPGRDYRADAVEILAAAAPATGEMHDGNVMKSAWVGRDADRDFAAQVLEPGRVHVAELDAPTGDRRDAPEQTAQCYETSHPIFGDDCLLCCTGPDCYMVCTEGSDQGLGD